MTALDIVIDTKEFPTDKLKEVYSQLIYYAEYPIGPPKEEFTKMRRNQKELKRVVQKTVFKDFNVTDFMKQIKKSVPPNCFLYIRVLNRDEIIAKIGLYGITFKVVDIKNKRVIAQTNKPQSLPANWAKVDLYELQIPSKKDPSGLKLYIDVWWNKNANKQQTQSTTSDKNNFVHNETSLNNLEVDVHYAIRLKLNQKQQAEESTSLTLKSVSNIMGEGAKTFIPQIRSEKSKSKEKANNKDLKAKPSLFSRLCEKFWGSKKDITVVTKIENVTEEPVSAVDPKLNPLSLLCDFQLGAQRPNDHSSNRLVFFNKQITLYILLVNQGKKSYPSTKELKDESKWSNLYEPYALYILNQARLHSTLTEFEDDFCRVIAMCKIYAKYARVKNAAFMVDAIEKLQNSITVHSNHKITGSWPAEMDSRLDSEVFYIITKMIFDFDMPVALLCETIFPFNGYGEYLFISQIALLEKVSKLAQYIPNSNSNYEQYKTKVTKHFLKCAKKWLDAWSQYDKIEPQSDKTKLIHVLRVFKVFALSVRNHHKGIELSRASIRTLQEINETLDKYLSQKVIALKNALKTLQKKLPEDYTVASETIKRNAILQAMPFKDAYNSLRLIAEALQTTTDETGEGKERITVLAIQRWFPLNVTQAWVASEIKKIESECAFYEKDITKLETKKMFEDAKSMYDNLLGFVSWSNAIFPARTAKDIVYCIDLVAVVFKMWYQKLKTDEREKEYSLLNDKFVEFINMISNVANALAKNVSVDPDLRTSVVDWILTQEKSWKGVLRAYKWRYEKKPMKSTSDVDKYTILTVGEKRQIRLGQMSLKSRKLKKKKS